MKKLNDRNYYTEGDLYTNMYMDPRLLDNNGIVIHVKGDVFLGVLEKPKTMKTKDFYLDYEEFVKNYGGLYDIIAFSNLFNNKL